MICFKQVDSGCSLSGLEGVLLQTSVEMEKSGQNTRWVSEGRAVRICQWIERGYEGRGRGKMAPTSVWYLGEAQVFEENQDSNFEHNTFEMPMRH